MVDCVYNGELYLLKHIRRSPRMHQMGAAVRSTQPLASEMVDINEFPSEETVNSNESEQRKLRTLTIRNVKKEPLMEMENEDRVLTQNREGRDKPELGDTSTGDGEAEIPSVGMTFNSFDEARDFYGDYASKKGFSIITRSTKCGDNGNMKYYTLACSRAGKTVCSRKSRLLPKPAVKIDCKARINIRACRDGKLYLSGFISEHNHELSPGNSSYTTCNTRLGPHPKRLIESDDQVERQVNNNFQLLAVNENVSSGKEENANYISRSGNLRLGEGDAESIFNYFVCMQKQDPNFFYVPNMNEDCCLRNVFWADGRSQALYESFGDVIAFESRYLNNEYKLPLVSFVGVNHHGQSTLLGCGLLFQDDKESYMWLFRSWLKCMSGQPPKAIVTDQCPSIQEAVSEVFPEVRHRLCLQHIMKKISSKLGGLPNYLEIENALKSSVFESSTIQEFEESWEIFIKEFKLENIDWLKMLYLDRALWVPAFVKRTFWAGLSTTERNENVKAFFDGYIQPETTLKQFMEQYNTVLRSKIEKEEHADFTSSSSIIPTITDFPLEKQFQEAYTNEMFKLFQEELRGLIYCNTSLVTAEGPMFTFQVKDYVKKKDGSRRKVVYEVLFNNLVGDVWCKCCLFEFHGILCRHQVAVLFDQDVKEVPSHYILSRWRKDIKRKHEGVNSCSEVIKTYEQMVHFGKLHTARHPIAEIGAESEESSGTIQEPLSSLAKDGDEVKYSGEKLQYPLAGRCRGCPPMKKKKGCETCERTLLRNSAALGSLPSHAQTRSGISSIDWRQESSSQMQAHPSPYMVTGNPFGRSNSYMHSSLVPSGAQATYNGPFPGS